MQGGVSCFGQGGWSYVQFHFLDAAFVECCYFECVAVEGYFFAFFREIAFQFQQQSGQRVGFFGVVAEGVVVDVGGFEKIVQRYFGFERIGVVVDLGVEFLFLVVFVADVAHHFFQNVFHGYHAECAAKFIDHDGDVNFVFLKSIFDFIITGYLDKELLKQELNQIYNKYSEEEKAYRKLQDFLYLEEKEGKELVFKIIEYLNSGKFHLAIILKLYSSFKLIQERGYIENFNHNLEELFTNAIEESSKNIENIPMADRFVMDDIVFDNSLKDDATYLKLSDLVREKAGVKQSNSQIDVIKTLFSDANSDCRYPERYEFGKLYNDIVYFKLEPLFFSLNNKGIAYFQSLLHNDVIRIKDPWQTDKLSKSALEHIKSFIEDNIQNQELDNMRRKRFSDLLDVMDKSIKALTKPNENSETN